MKGILQRISGTRVLIDGKWYNGAGVAQFIPRRVGTVVEFNALNNNLTFIKVADSSTNASETFSNFSIDETTVEKEKEPPSNMFKKKDLRISRESALKSAATILPLLGKQYNDISELVNDIVTLAKALENYIYEGIEEDRDIFK